MIEILWTIRSRYKEICLKCISQLRSMDCFEVSPINSVRRTFFSRIPCVHCCKMELRLFGNVSMMGLIYLKNNPSISLS